MSAQVKSTKSTKSTKVVQAVESVPETKVTDVVEETPKVVAKSAAKKSEGKKSEGKKSEGKKSEGKKSEGKKSEGKKSVVVEDSESPVEEEVEVTSDVKKPVTKDSIIKDMDDIIVSIDSEIVKIRGLIESSGKVPSGVKFLRGLLKQLKVVKIHSSKVMKHKQPSTRSNTNNSGFLKPVTISSEMARFTGWDVNEQKSRVAVTKFICDYIKNNNLQNPTDRRQIVADPKLAKLLSYDSKKDEPLTYYRIQSYLKPHFITAVTAK